MSKIVIELQKKCLDTTIPCSNLLMQAYAIASKLSINNMIEFFTHEMEGYKDIDVDFFPQYRQVIVCTEALDPFYNSWKPITFPSNAPMNKHYVAESIAEIESFGPANAQTLEIRPNAEMQKIIRSASNTPESMQIHQIFSASQFTAIPQKVRKLILDWALNLEKEGILGENLVFSSEEQKIAKENPSVQIIINGDVFGSNVSGILKDSIAKVQSQGK